MHSTQQPSYAERNDDGRIGLCLNGIFHRSFKAASGFAGCLRSGIVNVLRCVNCIAGDARRIFLRLSNARPKSALEALLSAMGSSIQGAVRYQTKFRPDIRSLLKSALSRRAKSAWR